MDTAKPPAKRYNPSCWNCDSDGHVGRECKAPKATCTTCGKVGHCTASHGKWKAHSDKRKALHKKGVEVKTVRFEDDGAEVDFDLCDLEAFTGSLTVETGDDGDIIYDSGMTFGADGIPCVIEELFHDYEEPMPELVDYDSDTDSDDDDPPPLIYSDSESESDEPEHHYDEDIFGDYSDDDVPPPLATRVMVNRMASKPDSIGDLAIIDSGALENVVSSGRLLAEVKDMRRPVNIVGVGGHKSKVTQDGELKKFPFMSALLLEPSAESTRTYTDASGNIIALGRLVDAGYYY